MFAGNRLEDEILQVRRADWEQPCLSPTREERRTEWATRWGLDHVGRGFCTALSGLERVVDWGQAYPRKRTELTGSRQSYARGGIGSRPASGLDLGKPYDNKSV